MSLGNLHNFQWCANDDTFIVLDNNVLTLYGIEEVDKNYVLQNRELKLSESCVAKELNIFKKADRNKKFKCFAVCPDPDNHQNVLLADKDKPKVIVVDMNTCDEIGECQVKTRIINLLEWSKLQRNYAAIGTSDRVRSLKGVHIVDVKRICGGDNKSRGIVTELGNQGDAVKSMSWSPHSSNELAAGFSRKNLRIFDMRTPDNVKSIHVNDVQEIEGICYAPRSENILASYNDETVRLWDKRYLKKDPLYREKLNLSTGDIEKIAWCPSQDRRLGVITKGSRHVHIMDFSKSDGDRSDSFLTDQAVGTRHKSPPNMLESHISNFSWHPTAQNRILCCKRADNDKDNTMLCDMSLCEKIAVEWSSHNQLVWGCANSLVSCTLSSDTKPDIAEVIYQRIDQGYAFSAEKNIALVQDDQNLAVFWQFFQKVQKEHPWDCRLGVAHFFHTEREKSKSEEMDIIPNDPRTYYVSEARKKALEVCGWPQKQNKAEIQNRITDLHNRGEYNKSAAIALFYMGVKQAMEQLTKPESPNSNNGKTDSEHLYIFSVALSGYTDNRSSQWYEQSKLLAHTTDPYQRAMFEFLTVEPNTSEPYKKILEDKQLELEDRIGFACRFLPDKKLRDYIASVTEREVVAGNIKAVILTGVSSNLVELMQKYLDDTSDIQTVCLALCLAKAYTGYMKLPDEFTGFPDQVLESYRQLFDVRSLWIERAAFDVKRLNILQLNKQSIINVMNNKVVGPHIQIKCPNCKKSVAGGSNNPSATYTKSRTQHQQRRTIRCCPNTACKNPLPRCSLCLFNLGTPSQYSPSKPVIRQTRNRLSDNRSLNTRENPTDKWFVWCQGCGHGGHAQHMQDWFKEHKQCPVPNCDCRCSILDDPGHIDPPL